MSNIRPEFQSDNVSPDQVERIDAVRAAFSSLLADVELHVPPSRERSLVLTKLQEASMWAVRGIAAPPTPQTARPPTSSTPTRAA